MWDSIAKDGWHMVGHFLPIRDLLELRRTCSVLNKYVICMQSRWYRAHQMYLMNIGKMMKVKSAQKVHMGRLTPACVPAGYAYPGRSPVGHHLSWHVLDIAYQKAIDDGEFQECHCAHPSHFQYKKIKSEHDIPLDKNFKPRRNNYIYFYLIECYRYKSRKHNEKINCLQQSIKYHEQGINHQLVKIEQYKAKIRHYESQLEERKQKYVGNDIFKNTLINGYKTPAKLRKE